MKVSKVVQLVFAGALLLAAGSGCGGDNTPKDGEELAPMVIERGDTGEGVPGAIFDEAYNTQLVLKIQRVVFTSHSGSEVQLELETELPLFARGFGEGANVYAEGTGKGVVFGGVAGVGESEGEWGIVYDVIGEIWTDCSMWLMVEEEWLEGYICTTVLGQQTCETTPGDEFQLAYGVLKFPYIIGPATNIEELSFESGPSTFVTAIEVMRSGQGAINLPEVRGCNWDDLE